MKGFITTAGNYTGQMLELELRKYLNKISRRAPGWDATALCRLLSSFGDYVFDEHSVRRMKRFPLPAYRVGIADTPNGDFFTFRVVFHPKLGPLLEGYLTGDDLGKPTIRRHLTMTTDGQFRLF